MLTTKIGDFSEKTKFMPCGIINAPLFYDRQIAVNVGLYRQICQNGMIAAAAASQFNFSANSREDFMIIENMPNILENFKPMAEQFNRLGEMPLNNEDAINVLRNIGETRELYPKLIVMCMKHLFDLAEGLEPPKNSPTEMTNYMDLLNLVTFYAHELPSMGSQAQGEKQAFNFFYKSILGNKPNKKEDFFIEYRKKPKAIEEAEEPAEIADILTI